MQRSRATETAANVPKKVLAALLLLCTAVSGCGTTCVSGVLNGNPSGIMVTNPCPLGTATGAVTLQIGSASPPSGVSAVFPPPLVSPSAFPADALPHNVEHIFVTLRGIEANPDIAADEDSPAWQELAPDLSAHPVQVDLLAPSPAAPLAEDAIVPATVPADEYRQLRLRLLALNPAPNEPVPESNACGDVGWNCIVFADRSARPFEFAAPARSEQSELGLAPEFAAASVRQLGFSPAEFHITPEHGAAGLFRVLPGELIHLSIEFDSASSIFFSSAAAVRLVPVFRAVSR
jgi:hypothetical protein